MELSSDVLTGLGYLANGSHFADDSYKKIVNSSLGLLAGEPNIERITNICPEKGDVVRKSYSALLIFSVQLIRFSCEEEIRSILGKQNLKSDRIDYFIKSFNLNKEGIVKSLKNTTTSWPNLIDVNWRLDFILKSNAQNHIGKPLYFIILSTAKEGKIDYIKFTCDLHQLQDLCTKVKEIDNSELWNDLNLQAPPVCTIKTVSKMEEIAEMKNALSSAESTLKDLKLLHTEAALLSRYLYKFKRLFRHDKGLMYMVQINQALHRYLKLNILGAVTCLKDCFPSKIRERHTRIFLPTRQMLKFVLLRILSFSKLLVRIIELSKNAGCYLSGKIRLGWSWPCTIFALGMVGRILVYSMYALMGAYEWYNCLRPNLHILVETIPYGQGYDFPKTLEDFIGPIKLKPAMRKPDIDKIFEVMGLNNLDDHGNDNEIMLDEIFNHIESDKDDDLIIEEPAEQRRLRKRGREDCGASVALGNMEVPGSSRFMKKASVEDIGEPVTLRKKRKKNKKSRPN